MTMNHYTFSIPGEPQGKGRPRFDTRSGRAYTPEKTRAYEDLVRWSYHGPCFTGAVRMEITAYLKVPKNLTKARMAEIQSGIDAPTKKPDADNVLKAVADALNGLAYKDDAQVTDVIVRKRWSTDPRVEVVIEDACAARQRNDLWNATVVTTRYRFR